MLHGERLFRTTLAKCTTENGRTRKIDIVISGALSLAPASARCIQIHQRRASHSEAATGSARQEKTGRKK
jgi:hypothetical protein